VEVPYSSLSWASSHLRGAGSHRYACRSNDGGPDSSRGRVINSALAGPDCRSGRIGGPGRPRRQRL